MSAPEEWERDAKEQPASGLTPSPSPPPAFSGPTFSRPIGAFVQLGSGSLLSIGPKADALGLAEVRPPASSLEHSDASACPTKSLQPDDKPLRHAPEAAVEPDGSNHVQHSGGDLSGSGKVMDGLMDGRVMDAFRPQALTLDDRAGKEGGTGQPIDCSTAAAEDQKDAKQDGLQVASRAEPTDAGPRKSATTPRSTIVECGVEGGAQDGKIGMRVIDRASTHYVPPASLRLKPDLSPLEMEGWLRGYVRDKTTFTSPLVFAEVKWRELSRLTMQMEKQARDKSRRTNVSTVRFNHVRTAVVFDLLYLLVGQMASPRVRRLMRFMLYQLVWAVFMHPFCKYSLFDAPESEVAFPIPANHARNRDLADFAVSGALQRWHVGVRRTFQISADSGGNQNSTDAAVDGEDEEGQPSSGLFERRRGVYVRPAPKRKRASSEAKEGFPILLPPLTREAENAEQSYAEGDALVCPAPVSPFTPGGILDLGAGGRSVQHIRSPSAPVSTQELSVRGRFVAQFRRRHNRRMPPLPVCVVPPSAAEYFHAMDPRHRGRLRSVPRPPSAQQGLRFALAPSQMGTLQFLLSLTPYQLLLRPLRDRNANLLTCARRLYLPDKLRQVKVMRKRVVHTMTAFWTRFVKAWVFMEWKREVKRRIKYKRDSRRHMEVLATFNHWLGQSRLYTKRAVFLQWRLRVVYWMYRRSRVELGECYDEYCALKDELRAVIDRHNATVAEKFTTASLLKSQWDNLQSLRRSYEEESAFLDGLSRSQSDNMALVREMLPTVRSLAACMDRQRARFSSSYWACADALFEDATEASAAAERVVSVESVLGNFLKLLGVELKEDVVTELQDPQTRRALLNRLLEFVCEKQMTEAAALEERRARLPFEHYVRSYQYGLTSSPTSVATLAHLKLRMTNSLPFLCPTAHSQAVALPPLFYPSSFSRSLTSLSTHDIMLMAKHRKRMSHAGSNEESGGDGANSAKSDDLKLSLKGQDVAEPSDTPGTRLSDSTEHKTDSAGKESDTKTLRGNVGDLEVVGVEKEARNVAELRARGSSLTSSDAVTRDHVLSEERKDKPGSGHAPKLPKSAAEQTGSAKKSPFSDGHDGPTVAELLADYPALGLLHDLSNYDGKEAIFSVLSCMLCGDADLTESMRVNEYSLYEFEEILKLASFEQRHVISADMSTEASLKYRDSCLGGMQAYSEARHRAVEKEIEMHEMETQLLSESFRHLQRQVAMEDDMLVHTDKPAKDTHDPDRTPELKTGRLAKDDAHGAPHGVHVVFEEGEDSARVRARQLKPVTYVDAVLPLLFRQSSSRSAKGSGKASRRTHNSSHADAVSPRIVHQVLYRLLRDEAQKRALRRGQHRHHNARSRPSSGHAGSRPGSRQGSRPSSRQGSREFTQDGVDDHRAQSHRDSNESKADGEDDRHHRSSSRPNSSRDSPSAHNRSVSKSPHKNHRGSLSRTFKLKVDPGSGAKFDLTSRNGVRSVIAEMALAYARKAESGSAEHRPSSSTDAADSDALAVDTIRHPMLNVRAQDLQQSTALLSKYALDLHRIFIHYASQSYERQQEQESQLGTGEVVVTDKVPKLRRGNANDDLLIAEAQSDGEEDFRSPSLKLGHPGHARSVQAPSRRLRHQGAEKVTRVPPPAALNAAEHPESDDEAKAESRPDLLALPEFLRFVKQCRFGKDDNHESRKSERVHKERIMRLVPMEVSELVFMSVHDGCQLSEFYESAHHSSSSAQRFKDQRGSANRSSKSHTQGASGALLKDINFTQFCTGLVRLGVYTFTTEKFVSTRCKLVIEAALAAAVQNASGASFTASRSRLGMEVAAGTVAGRTESNMAPTALNWAHLLHSKAVNRVIRSHMPKLKQLFTSYGRTSGVSGNRISVNFTTILAFARDFELLNTYVNTHELRALFVNVQTGGLSGNSAVDLLDAKMSLPGFLEFLAALSNYVERSPFLNMADRVDRFLRVHIVNRNSRDMMYKSFREI